METFRLVLRTREFWAAVVLFAAALLNWLAPTAPREVTTSFLALLGVIASVLTVQAARAQAQMLHDETLKRLQAIAAPSMTEQVREHLLAALKLLVILLTLTSAIVTGVLVPTLLYRA